MTILKMLTVHLVFLFLSVVVTAAGLGVVTDYLTKATEMSPFVIVSINLSLWAFWFLTFLWGIKLADRG